MSEIAGLIHACLSAARRFRTHTVTVEAAHWDSGVARLRLHCCTAGACGSYFLQPDATARCFAL
jgi:hypothetical protein